VRRIAENSDQITGFEERHGSKRAVLVLSEERKSYNTESAEVEHRGHGEFTDELAGKVAESAAPKGQ